jgi:hypothetical protein
VDRVQRSELGRIQVACTVKERVVESYEMDAGQEPAGFWNQTG